MDALAQHGTRTGIGETLTRLLAHLGKTASHAKTTVHDHVGAPSAPHLGTIINATAPPRGYLAAAYEVAFVAPLRRLYFRGPGLLFWGGRAPEDVCAALTGVAATHWAQSTDGACATLLSSSFGAFLVAVETLAYFLLLYRVACAAVDALCACRCRFPKRDQNPPNNDTTVQGKTVS